LFLYLDPCAPTIVSPKTNLVKGDLFAISLNDEGTQKLVMQVDKVDDERQIQPAIPGFKNKQFQFLLYLIFDFF